MDPKIFHHWKHLQMIRNHFEEPHVPRFILIAAISDFGRNFESTKRYSIYLESSTILWNVLEIKIGTDSVEIESCVVYFI